MLRGPRRVKRAILGVRRLRPGYPNKQTSSEPVGMSQKCQDRTWALLFNYFVGARKHCGRNFEVERLGGLEIDDQFEPGRLLDRQVGRFGAFENLVNEVSRAAIQAEKV